LIFANVSDPEWAGYVGVFKGKVGPSAVLQGSPKAFAATLRRTRLSAFGVAAPPIEMRGGVLRTPNEPLHGA
jgi:hypothetical protein